MLHDQASALAMSFGSCSASRRRASVCALSLGSRFHGSHSAVKSVSILARMIPTGMRDARCSSRPRYQVMEYFSMFRGSTTVHAAPGGMSATGTIDR